MFVGVMEFELLIPGATSLKDKRRVVKSLKDRLHRDHLVAVAEVEGLDHHRIAWMGVALVGNSQARIAQTMDRIHSKLQRLADARLGSVSREIFSGDHLPGTRDEDLWTEAEKRDAPNADADAGDAPEDRP